MSNEKTVCEFCGKAHKSETYYFWQKETSYNYYFCEALRDVLFLETVPREQRLIIKNHVING